MGQQNSPGPWWWPCWVMAVKSSWEEKSRERRRAVWFWNRGGLCLLFKMITGGQIHRVESFSNGNFKHGNHGHWAVYHPSQCLEIRKVEGSFMGSPSPSRWLRKKVRKKNPLTNCLMLLKVLPSLPLELTNILNDIMWNQVYFIWVFRQKYISHLSNTF